MMGQGQSPDPQAQSVRFPKKWPMVSRLQTREPIAVPLPGGTANPITKDAHLINGFAEFDPEDQEYWIYKRLSLGALQWSLGAGTPGSLYTDSIGFIDAVQANNLWRMNTTSGATNVGHVAGGAPFYFTEANAGPGGARYLVLTQAGSGQQVPILYEISPTPGFVALTGAPPPVGPGSVELDGTVYVMDINGSIWGSDLKNPANWTATNAIQADSESDQGVFRANTFSFAGVYTR